MSTAEAIKNLDKEISSRLDYYVGKAKKALDAKRIDNVAYWRGHIYGCIDGMEIAGKIDSDTARNLRVHFGYKAHIK